MHETVHAWTTLEPPHCPKVHTILERANIRAFLLLFLSCSCSSERLPDLDISGIITSANLHTYFDELKHTM